MFIKARLKLTVWYLLIIMLISVSFSVAIYNVLTNELNRVERVQRLRQEGQLFIIRERPPRPFAIDPQLIQETKDRLKTILLSINLGILGLSGLAGYFLAGRTLRPIKEMMDEQGRFITDASHELRTPLTSLKSEIEVSLRDKNLDLKEAKRLLNSNLEEVNNLQSLSDYLIELTQYGKNKETLKEVLLSEVIFASIKSVANLAKLKNIAIKTKIKDVFMEANKQSLCELLVIFLDNAIKYSPKNTTVILSSRVVDPSLFIDIKDKGIGIDAADIPHLFDRFYRADKSRSKNRAVGYGLGLSIAKQIVDKYKGSINVESEPKRGTVFTIRLPLKQTRTFLEL